MSDLLACKNTTFGSKNTTKMGGAQGPPNPILVVFLEPKVVFLQAKRSAKLSCTFFHKNGRQNCQNGKLTKYSVSLIQIIRLVGPRSRVKTEVVYVQSELKGENAELS